MLSNVVKKWVAKQGVLLKGDISVLNLTPASAHLVIALELPSPLGEVVILYQLLLRLPYPEGLRLVVVIRGRSKSIFTNLVQ